MKNRCLSLLLLITLFAKAQPGPNEYPNLRRLEMEPKLKIPARVFSPGELIEFAAINVDSLFNAKLQGLGYAGVEYDFYREDPRYLLFHSHPVYSPKTDLFHDYSIVKDRDGALHYLLTDSLLNAKLLKQFAAIGFKTNEKQPEIYTSPLFPGIILNNTISDGSFYPISRKYFATIIQFDNK
jgi:hypothetical protein